MKAKPEIDVNTLFHLVWKEHWNTRRFHESGWAIEVERLFERHINPQFGAWKLSSVTIKEVRAWHIGLKETPFAANRALEVLSKLFSYAEEQELKPPGTNPCQFLKAFPERKRKRFATKEELQKIGEILKRESAGNFRSVAFIYLLIFTGSRPRAIERARWSMLKRLDNGCGVLTFAGKTTSDSGEDEIVIFPPPAMTIVDMLKDLEERSNLPDKFGNTLTRIKMPRALWKKLTKEIGCEDLWIRDLRRTFATVGLSTGTEIGVIGELLNHKSTQTTSIYAKLMQENRVTAATNIADKITELFGSKK